MVVCCGFGSGVFLLTAPPVVFIVCFVVLTLILPIPLISPVKAGPLYFAFNFVVVLTPAKTPAVAKVAIPSGLTSSFPVSLFVTTGEIAFFTASV